MFRHVCPRGYGKALIRLSPRRTDDWRPALDFRCEKFRKCFRVQGAGIYAFGAQSLAHVGQLQDAPDFSIEFGDNVGRHARGTRQRKPYGGYEFWIAKFAIRRHRGIVGQAGA